jgi:MerR family redox-sensitive transcriptional activator SoxR
MRIGEVAQEAGVSTATLRYYEQIGILPAPTRFNGRREYDASVFVRLGLIRVAKAAGFTLREIRSLLHQPQTELPLSSQIRAHIERKMAEVEAKLIYYQAAHDRLAESLTCECVDLGDCTLLGTEEVL